VTNARFNTIHPAQDCRSLHSDHSIIIQRGKHNHNRDTMKIYLTALSTALLWSNASACSGTIASLTGIECTYQNFLNLLDASCTASDILGTDAAQAEATIAALCKYDASTQFVEIQGTYQADRRYFKGGGNLVDGEIDWHSRESNIQRFDDNLADSTLIAYPEYLARVSYNQNNNLGDNGYPANMNLETSCGLQTMMCCFIKDSYGTPEDEGGFSFGTAATDVCRHDLSDSPQSNHINKGWAVYPHSKTETLCVGFSWASEDEPLGNMLYDISLHNTVSKGYLEGVPGAPMCGCVEHMPTVETAACRTATVDSFEFTFNYNEEELTASNTASVAYSDCEGDLAAEYATKHPDAPDAISDYLVGEGGCAGDLETYLNDEQFIRKGQPSAARYSTPDENWSELIVGEGSRFMPPELDLSQTDSWFRDLINANCTTAGNDRMCIIRRICDSCQAESHRDIYYRRLTGLPPMGDNIDAGEVYFIDTFMNNWFDNINGVKFNVMGADFTLHSTYEDALTGENPWLFCNYNDPNIGFPRDCGPDTHQPHEWNSYRRGDGHANHHGFFVEVPSNDVQRKARYLSETNSIQTVSRVPALTKS